jgi:capsular polysaccharide biosynthesis protein
VKPNVLFNLVTTFVLAFIVGLSLPFYRQIIDNVLFHDYDVVKATGLPVLCSVRDVK